MKKKKVVLIGWDAADWQIIQPLLSEGKMPTLKKLIEGGVYGNMSTLNPPYSPMLWSSVATGMTPDKHGVLGFIELDSEAQIVRPVTVFQRKVNAIWNILHKEGYKSNVIGWWPSQPAEPINGVVVSDLFTKASIKKEKSWPIPNQSVHPKSILKDIKDLRIHPNEITAAHILPFVPDAASIPEDKIKPIGGISKILAENSSVHACSTYAMENSEWDFTAIYYDMIDHFCHGFMKYRAPKLPIIPKDLHEYYKGVVDGAYRYQDMMLERTIELAGEDALVIVMSDHGFVSDSKRRLKMPKFQAAPALDHREFGIFVANGPGIKKGEKVSGINLMDITPTILTYFGLPVGNDMDGKVLVDIFQDAPEINHIPSWEVLQGDFGRHKKKVAADPLSEQKAIEQLVELGYVERPEENMEQNLLKTRCDLQYNLARVYIGKGEYEKAEALLLELLDEKINTEHYLLELSNLNTLQKKFQDAKKHLYRLRALDAEAEKKTKFLEAKILIGTGEVKIALKLLKEIESKSILKANMNYELGRIFISMNELKRSLIQFKAAVEKEPEKAKYQNALAINYLKLGEFDLALNYALNAVDIVKHYPGAHYTLGQIFEGMGDKLNAKIAYQTAKDLDAKIIHPRLKIENLEREESLDNAVVTSEFPEVIIVSGLPRSGTSMMMQMLDSAGLPVLIDGKRKEDVDNPKGYYEYEKVKSLHKDNKWMHEAEGKVVKVIAQLLRSLPLGFRYKVIYMTRDIEEVIESQRIMLKNNGLKAKEGLRKVYENELKKLEIWKDRNPGLEFIHVSYQDVLDKPEKEVLRISKFLNKDLDEKKMLAPIDKKLHRNRIYKFKI